MAKKLIVEDNIIVRGEVCSAGSRMLANFRPPFQAESVDRALAAGYELCGRADIGEFSMEQTGESCRNGAITDPKDAATVASAAACAVRDGEADAALLVDAGGKALRLAALSGVPAYRPTYGMVSRHGIIATVSSVEQIAAAAPSVGDAAALIQSVAGHDCKDATSIREERYDLACEANVRGKKIAVLDNMQHRTVSRETLFALEAAEATLQTRGAKTERLVLPYLEYAFAALTIMAAAEGCNNISRFDGVKYGYRSENYKSIEDLYRNSRSESMGRQAKFTAMLGTHVLSKGNYELFYKKALQARRLIRESFDFLFNEFDAAILPLACSVAYPVGAEATEHLGEADLAWGAPASLAGLPCVGLPFGKGKDGKPLALQVIANTKKDANALAVAKVLEGGVEA